MKKNVTIAPEQREILKKALEDAQNEKLDLFESIVGGTTTAACDAAAGIHYSQSTYVRRVIE